MKHFSYFYYTISFAVPQIYSLLYYKNTQLSRASKKLQLIINKIVNLRLYEVLQKIYCKLSSLVNKKKSF